MRTLIQALVLVVSAVACRQAPAPDPLPTPVEVSVGRHDLVLSVPSGCIRFDHGREQRFRCNEAQLALTDYGPVTGEGFRREVRNARGLFRKGQVDDARAHLRTLGLKTAFDERRWLEVSDQWNLVLGLGRHRSAKPHEIDTACAKIEYQVTSLSVPELSSVVERVMPEIDRATHREIGRSESLTVGGRPAISLVTWDKMTHDHRKNFLFVLNNDNLLVLGMGLGRFDEMEQPFRELSASLVIRPRDYSTSALR